MSMSTHVTGFRPPDERWKQMKAIWDSCGEAGIEVPDEVYDFFIGQEPDERGVTVDLEPHECCTTYRGDMEDGYEIEVAKLPPEITHIRVYNSY